MKAHEIPKAQEQLAIQLKPIISYPRVAEIGETYLLTIDVQLAADSPWPYSEEEFEISFVLETAPCFIHEPLGEHEPGIVLHRFGGTYGAAEYLLTASKQEVEDGHIKIAFLNGWGLPIAQLDLECEVKVGVPKTATQQVAIKEKRELAATPIPSIRPENTLPEKDLISKQLTQTGWDVRIAYLKQVHTIPKVVVPSGNIAITSYPSFENDYLLFINRKLVGVIKTVREYPEPLTQELLVHLLVPAEYHLDLRRTHSEDDLLACPGVPEKYLLQIADYMFERPLLMPNFQEAEQSLQSVPFVYYATAGLMINFRNYLEPETPSRYVYTFHQPTTLALWLKQAATGILDAPSTSFRACLRPMTVLTQISLYDYQFEALQRIEKSLAEYQSHTLIQIETGKGKTRIAINSIYRLLKHAHARHILYIVDMPLAKQYALEAFQDFIIPEDSQKFTDLYKVSLIGEEKLDPSVHVHIGILEDLYNLYSSGQDGEHLPLPIINDPVDAIRSFGDYCADLPIEYFDVIFLAESEYIHYHAWQPLLDYFDTFYIGIASDLSSEVLGFFRSNLVYPPMKTNKILQDKPALDAFLIRQKQLSSIIKGVRNLLRKDTGISGETDRLPQLVWLLLLKYLDDFEASQEELRGDEYIPIIVSPYRWRDWVVAESLTHRRKGDELLKFVNEDLIPYLGRLSGTDNRDIRSIIGTIFRGTYNRLRSGYILREVVDKISTINFNSSDDIHSVSLFYETMLKEMRDSAGDAGEFYTPRPVVRFIIDRLQPQLGESILDPACGTAGFLVEAYGRLTEQVKTIEQRQHLLNNLIGIEKKPMPYLLAIMNMLLHGIEWPNIVQRNALMTDFRQLQDKDHVDIIATNSPFGGEEERGVINNFPTGMRTAETVLLFVQYIMATLKRPGGRCGIVVPNGFLFRTGVATIIKQRLLTHFNLHTIVRLPTGVFSPYTSIPTNILFFEAGDDLNNSERNPCTKEVWYYEIPLPEGRKSYTKTNPLHYRDFHDCLASWDQRVENERAWKVSMKQLLANDCNLNVKNPRGAQDV